MVDGAGSDEAAGEASTPEPEAPDTSADASATPAATTDTPEKNSTDTSPANATTSTGQFDKYQHLAQAKVLVVEDAKPIRMMLRKTIGRVSKIADEAENGKIALTCLTEAAEREHPYDLVFLDLMMPVMDGSIALRHIRATEMLKATPVIIVTAKNSRNDVIECAKLGVSGYLLKPFKTQGVLEIAEKTLADLAAEPVAEVTSDGASSSA